MKRFAALLLSILMMTGASLAEIDWAEVPPGAQSYLIPYIDQVNQTLRQLNAGVVDVLHGASPTIAYFGMDGLMLDDLPLDENLPLEIDISYTETGLYALTLRVSELNRFEAIASAFLHAVSPEHIPLETARSVARGYAAVALQDRAEALANPSGAMTHGYEEEILDLQGDAPRAYFAYYPNQFGDGVAWLQMTVYFPRPGSLGGKLVLSVAPPPEVSTKEYEGFFATDNFSHFETFPSPTPEPDSAAMED